METRPLDPASLHLYLRRVGLEARPMPDFSGLAGIVRAHQQTIGFENLDIRLGRAIAIDSESVFAKIVSRGRGGYCFEKNRLLADALAALGLPSRPLLARVMLGAPPGEAPPLTHVCLLMEIEGQAIIADGGFGGSNAPPLPLVDGAERRAADAARYRLRRVGEPGSLGGEWLVERAAADRGDWAPQYAFGLQEVAPLDLAVANHWTSTRPATRFTANHIVSIALADGFASLAERELTVTRNGGAETRTIAELSDYVRTVREVFRIAITQDEAEALPLFVGTPITAR